MADYKVTDTELTSIANAIRTKGGTQAQLEFPTGFVSAVQAIPTGGGGVIQPLSVMQNGIYTPPSGIDGYAPVTVNVPGGSGAIVLLGTGEPSDSYGTDGNIYLKYANISTPSGFTRLAYLQSALSSTYIDTGVIATSDISAEIDYYDFEGYNNSYLFGFRPGSWNGFGINNNTNSAMYVYYGNVGNAYTLPNRTDAKIKLENGKITVDLPDYSHYEYTRAQAEFAYTYPIFIFAANNNGNPNYYGNYKFKNMKIWDAGTLIRDYYPMMRNSDNELGLYDYVNDVFYTNDGSGAFTGGSTAVDNPIEDAFLKVDGSWQKLIGSSANDVTT